MFINSKAGQKNLHNGPQYLPQISSNRDEPEFQLQLEDESRQETRNSSKRDTRARASAALQVQLIHQYRTIDEVRSDRRALRNYTLNLYDSSNSRSVTTDLTDSGTQSLA